MRGGNGALMYFPQPGVDPAAESGPKCFRTARRKTTIATQAAAINPRKAGPPTTFNPDDIRA